MPSPLRIALAQFDFPVGAVHQNADRIAAMIQQARDEVAALARTASGEAARILEIQIAFLEDDTLAEPAEAERATGYVVGGISPIGQRRVLATVLDSSANAFETILVSAGRRGLQIELAPSDLVGVTSAAVASIARGGLAGPIGPWPDGRIG